MSLRGHYLPCFLQAGNSHSHRNKMILTPQRCQWPGHKSDFRGIRLRFLPRRMVSSPDTGQLTSMTDRSINIRTRVYPVNCSCWTRLRRTTTPLRKPFTGNLSTYPFTTGKLQSLSCCTQALATTGILHPHCRVTSVSPTGHWWLGNSRLSWLHNSLAMAYLCVVGNFSSALPQCTVVQCDLADYKGNMYAVDARGFDWE